MVLSWAKHLCRMDGVDRILQSRPGNRSMGTAGNCGP